MDYFSFWGKKGDRVRLDGNILYGGVVATYLTGQLPAADDTKLQETSSGLSNPLTLDAILPADGQYYILISRDSYQQIGQYAFTFTLE